MRPVYVEYINWVNGITTSPAADALPDGFSPRGRNTNLVNIGQNTAQVGARKGPQTSNVTPVTGSPVMLGMYQLKRIDGSKTHLLVSSGGRLDKSNADTTTSAINATAFTSGTHFPSFATVNNFAIIANGVDLKKTDGTTVYAVGMTRPAAPTATAAVGGAMAANTWDVALTYFNSITGEESSLSDFTSVTLGGANFQINISWGAPADPQVDYVRVYLRNQTLGPNVYLVVAGLTPAPNATWNGFATSTLATVANVSNTQFGAFKIIAPTTNGNDPPAVTLQFPVWHHNRLFLFDSGNAYYSNITDLDARPESFDPNNVEPINPSDGDTITGAISYGGRLYIFKKYALWEIDGYDPSSWSVTQISDKYGCASHRTIKMAGGALYWWANSALGLLTMAAAGAQPLEVAKELLSASVSDTALNTLSLSIACAEVDEANDLILFALPEVGSTTRNTIVIPFNYRVKRFVADGWNPFDIASFCVVEDASTPKTVYAGGYSGQIFKWWQTMNDAVPTSTTGSGTVTSATTTTLTDSVAAFSTAGGGLIERYVYYIPAIGPVQRRRITANTATQLTVTPAWDTTLVPADSYIVGGIDWQLDTRWEKFTAAFIKKRFEFLSLEASSDQSVIIKVDVFTKDNLVDIVKTLTFTMTSAGAVYDTAVYDTDVYATSGRLNKRKNIGVTGKSIRLRIRQLQANKQITLNKIGLQANLLGTKT